VTPHALLKQEKIGDFIRI